MKETEPAVAGTTECEYRDKSNLTEIIGNLGQSGF